MDNFIIGIINVAGNIWENFINIAMTLFSTSPTAASGSVYTVAKGCFDALNVISLPLCTAFFLIAIVKDVAGSPPEQQTHRLFMDAFKFCIMVAVLANLWTIMGIIIDFTDAITDTLVGSIGDVSVAEDFSSAVSGAITDLCKLDFSSVRDFSLFDIPGFLLDVAMAVGAWIVGMLIAFITSLVILVLYASSGITIINCAYQRIIKPLVILPFSTIMVSMQAGSGEWERVSTSYLRSFVGLCISGAFMVVCVKLGIALVTGDGILGKLGGGGSALENFLIRSVEFSLMPLLTAGLVKGVDGMISRFL